MAHRFADGKVVRVKICGITNWADAKVAIDSGADALGFNFYAKSPRRVSVAHACEIIKHMPRSVSAVGVFVDELEKKVLRIARAVKLNILQLHGNEDAKTVERLAREFPVIKAFRVSPDFQFNDLKKYQPASAFLLDGFDAHLHGGTGRSFDWRVARKAKRFGRIIVAGGLIKTNAIAAIRRAEPFAIDVCSGVEASPGKKDKKKLREFMAAIKSKRGKQR